ncbi:hypothetical protein F5050DRAFT_1804380 [Lentinula boryana]|uniref:Chromatin target of PRMT1 protein C-terminal domain-containing protein n=1 Tax=Lentinula boryana TaxID=40481 RepID=A0ABQ8QNR8_9AGAR|nr:hypothetical protein F5050DRAFT_1804380 [Lentinula boryana]
MLLPPFSRLTSSLLLFSYTHTRHIGTSPSSLPLVERPMKIEIVVDPTRAAPGPSLAARVAPATEAIAQPNGTRNATRGGARRGRGRGGRSRKNDRPNKSAADLDAEMEDYTSSTAPAVPAAAA